MKICDQKDIWGPCGACGAKVAVISHGFTLGKPARGEPIIHEYSAALYHNRALGVNLCDAACAVKFQNKLLDNTVSS
tara:strand:- start:343 stop:573 length:231 start_codon:yes stop_codon:yes gene_type:complete